MNVTLVACLAVVVLLGVGGTYAIKTRRDTVRVTEFARVGEAGARAHAAYRHKPAPEAISALSQYLLTLQEAESNPVYGSYMPSGTIRFDMALAHARLAKLYERINQPELSARHVAQALAYANTAARGSVITNWTALEEVVARIDNNAKD
jgi:hypothetical protein